MTAMHTKIQEYQLQNDAGLIVRFTNLGGRITSIKLPGKEHDTDIIAGAKQTNDYISQDEYMGAICGRSANRIENASFLLNGTKIQLSKNADNNHLHGGFNGFHTKYWQVSIINGQRCQLDYLSPDGEEGYPGKLKVTAIYELNNENEFRILFTANSDKATIVNLTSHPYFNLKGFGSILDHQLWVHAGKFTPLNKELVPSGKFEDLKNTRYDFRTRKTLSSVFRKFNMHGIDQNFVLSNNGQFQKIAELSHPETGRSLELFSSQPGLQIYTGMHFRSTTGKDGNALGPNMAIALEPQQLPNCPNLPEFGNSILQKEECYEHTILYKFNY